MNVRRSLVRFTALTVVVAMPLLGMAGVATAAPKGSAKWCASHAKAAKKTPACSSTKPGGTGGPPPTTEIQVTVKPNPINETGVSELHAVVQVEAHPDFDHDNVFICSQQLVNSCEDVSFEVNEGTDLSVPQGESATVAL